MIPFLGTALGAACVFFVKNSIKLSVHKILLGFASGVMVAASVWSLLIPAIDMSAHLYSSCSRSGGGNDIFTSDG